MTDGPTCESELTDLRQQLADARRALAAAEAATTRTLFRASRLSQVVKVLGQHTELTELSGRAACEVAELFASDVALLMLGDDEALRVEGHWGIRPEHLPSGPAALPATVRDAGDRVIVGTPAEVGYPDWLSHLPVEHVAWAPLAARGESRGVVMLARRAAEPYDASDAQELRAVATRIALAVDNALLYRGVQEQLDRTARLYRLTTELAGTLNLALDEVAMAVARAIHSEIPSVGTAVYLPADDGFRLAASAGLAGGSPVRVERAALDNHSLEGQVLPLKAGSLDNGAVVVAGAPPPDSDGWSLLLHIVELAGLVVDKALLYDRTRRQAQRDTLTGLPNRALLIDRLDHALARAQRTSSRVVVIFLDIDRFKVINDSLGHGAGDEMLIHVARRLEEAVRAGDTVARLGGDEFVVVCEDIDGPEQAIEIASRIQTTVAGSAMVIGEAKVSATVSQGIAFADLSGYSCEAVLRDADTALYRAKERGRDRYELFDEGLRTSALSRLNVERGLRDAIDDDRLRVHYQPIVALPDGEVQGAEALLRYEDPDGRLAMPVEFMNVAEESGLIVPMGEWILQEACLQAAEWHRDFRELPPVAIAVNLSGHQILRADLPEVLARVLAASGISPELLHLEITESVLMESDALTTGSLEAVKALGVRLGIDDFGTGHSSLAYLKRLPVDFIKIDRSFVSSLDSDPADFAIVAAIVGLASSLGLHVVAEGVETASQLDRLEQLGIHAAQGYHFARPMTAEAFSSRLAGRSPVTSPR